MKILPHSTFFLILSLIIITKAAISLILPKAIIGAIFTTSVIMGGFFTKEVQFETAQDIPTLYFKENRQIKGYIEKISDGDTYKLRHITSKVSSRAFDGPIKEHTIIIRIAAVDTPETAKYGNPGQPFAKEAMKFASDELLNKEVKVKLLSKDQYGRVIGLVKYRKPGWLWGSTERDISEELLKNGLAVVYRQGGAKYDGPVAKWDALESSAKRSKKGIWSQSNFQSPGDYKKSIKNENSKTLANQL